MKAPRLIDGMRSRLAIREQGVVSSRGEGEGAERDLRGAGENQEAPVCVQTHAEVFLGSLLPVLVLSARLAAGRLGLRTGLVLACSLKVSMKVWGSTGGQAGLPGAHQGFS